MWDFLKPKGSDGPAVYWLRRALVFGVPLVLVITVAAIAWPRGTATVTNPTPSLAVPSAASSGPWIVPSMSVTPSPSAVEATTPSVAPSTTVTVAPPKKPVETLPPPPPICSGSDIRVSIDDLGDLVSGQPQELKLGFSNRNDKTCLLNVNSKLLTVKVVSGNDNIWTTNSCSKWVPEVKGAKLDAGQGHTLKMTWPGKRSAGGCDISNEKLGAGTYRIEVSYEGANTFKKSVIMKRA